MAIVDDQLIMPAISSVCFFCVHLAAGSVSKRTCAAFPRGIPPEIWRGDNPHTSAYRGDHGIQFTPYPLDGEGGA